ncbi:hypothetical protein ACHMXB_14775 [Arthrobacter sp. UC242_113]|uniref:hypothetical protein n=1 Tax=Arthrobacter sp. UC242_113 TaxID=3374550 RepID=UPI00375754AF
MSDTVNPVATEVDQQELARLLLAQAREQGIDMVGPDGLLNRLRRTSWKPLWMPLLSGFVDSERIHHGR